MEQMARKHGTPLYIYSAGHITERVALFQVTTPMLEPESESPIGLGSGSPRTAIARDHSPAPSSSNRTRGNG